MFLYFFSWLITVGTRSDVSIFFTFLTIWSFLIFNLYLLVSALSVSTEFIRVNLIKSSSRSDLTHTYKLSRQSPRGCCGYADNRLSWYLSVHWFFFVLGNMFAVTIPLLYWPLLYRGGETLTPEDFHVHLINGIFAFADIILSGIPIHFYHLLYLMIFGCIYSLFSGLYFAGTQNIIYPVLDYENHVGGAVGVCFAVIFVVIPIIYLVIFFVVYKIKMLILYRIWGTEVMEEYERLPRDQVPRNQYDTFSEEKIAPV